MSVEFCDTNLFVYAYDRSAGEKHHRARDVVNGLWQSANGALSIQVLQELFVTLTRKLATQLTLQDARSLIADLATWRVVEPNRQDVLEAIDNSQRWRISFWDAMLLTTADKAGASVLWSEDLNHGQVYGGVTVCNPFREP